MRQSIALMIAAPEAAASALDRSSAREIYSQDQCEGNPVKSQRVSQWIGQQHIYAQRNEEIDENKNCGIFRSNFRVRTNADDIAN